MGNKSPCPSIYPSDHLSVCPFVIRLEGSEGQPEGTKGQPEGSEGQPEGCKGQSEGSEGQPEGSDGHSKRV